MSATINTARPRHREASRSELVKKAHGCRRAVAADRTKIGRLIMKPACKPLPFPGARRDRRHGRRSHVGAQRRYEFEERCHRFSQRGLGATRRAVF